LKSLFQEVILVKLKQQITLKNHPRFVMSLQLNQKSWRCFEPANFFPMMHRREKEGFLAAEVVQHFFLRIGKYFYPTLYVTINRAAQAGLVDFK